MVSLDSVVDNFTRHALLYNSLIKLYKGLKLCIIKEVASLSMFEQPFRRLHFWINVEAEQPETLRHGDCAHAYMLYSLCAGNCIF